MRIAFRAAGVICLLGISANSSAAEPSILLLGGAEFSPDTSYAYLGQVAPLSEDSSSNGFVRKLWLDWSKYHYEGGGGQTYYVSAPGAAISLGYRGVTENHWWAAYAGMAYRNSSISPVDLTSTVRGGMLRPQLQLEGEQSLDQKWKVAGNGSYIQGQQAYWVRGRVLRNIWSGQQIGLEAITQGDPTYSANQFGVLLAGLKAGNTLNIGFKMGVRRETNLSSQPYFGIELGSMY
jgi:hypothetical protein